MKDKIVYQVFVDCWQIAKKYIFKELTDEDWEAMNADIEERGKKYQEETAFPYWKLYCEVAVAVVTFKERVDRQERCRAERDKTA